MTRVADTASRTARPDGRRNPSPFSRASLRAEFDRTATVLCAVVIVLAAAGVWSGAPITAAVVAAATLPAAIVDLRVHRLPDTQLLGAALAGVAAAVVERILGARLDAVDFFDVLVGVAAIAGPLLILHLAAPGSMGFGDVKLAVVLGGGLGVVDPIAGLVALAVAGAVGTVAGIAGRHSTIPFGPALVLGASASILITPWVVRT